MTTGGMFESLKRRGDVADDKKGEMTEWKNRLIL